MCAETLQPRQKAGRPNTPCILGSQSRTCTATWSRDRSRLNEASRPTIYLIASLIRHTCTACGMPNSGIGNANVFPAHSARSSIGRKGVKRRQLLQNDRERHLAVRNRVTCADHMRGVLGDTATIAVLMVLGIFLAIIQKSRRFL